MDLEHLIFGNSSIYVSKGCYIAAATYRPSLNFELHTIYTLENINV